MRLIKKTNQHTFPHPSYTSYTGNHPTPKPVIVYAWVTGDDPRDGHYTHANPNPHQTPIIKRKSVPGWKSPVLA